MFFSGDGDCAVRTKQEIQAEPNDNPKPLERKRNRQQPFFLVPPFAIGMARATVEPNDPALSITVILNRTLFPISTFRPPRKKYFHFFQTVGEVSWRADDKNYYAYFAFTNSTKNATQAPIKRIELTRKRNSSITYFIFLFAFFEYISFCYFIFYSVLQVFIFS